MKTIFEKEMSISQSSHFWYEAFQTLLWRFLINSYFWKQLFHLTHKKVFRSTSVGESSSYFEFETDRNIYLDMGDEHLSLKLQLVEERTFDAFKRKKAELKENQRKTHMRNRNRNLT